MAVKVTTRTRAKSSTASAKTPPKKTATTKAPATKTTARATPSRARKSAAPEVKDTPAPARRTTRPAAKKAAATPPKTVKETAAQSKNSYQTLQDRRDSANPRKKVGGMTYKELSELSGYGLGSEQFIVAVAIVTGGTSRLDINHRIAAQLPPTTRNGTPKAVSNLVSGVIKRLEDRGFTISGSWKMVAPKE